MGSSGSGGFARAARRRSRAATIGPPRSPVALKVFFDTSVLVASLVSGHPHHSRAMPLVRRVLLGQDRGCIAAHALAETYAVLTVLPVTPRIGPEAAQKLVADNLVGRFEVVALTAREYETLLDSLPERGAIGGAVYDAVQLACATKANVGRIYTFNVADFTRLDPDQAARITAP
ncbi:MAG: type II toxin-antitoxin system VapC family toxin [Candidatus Binatia bacterium]